MLRFNVYRDGDPAETVELAGAYLFGQEGIPVRAEITISEGQITCQKRVSGAAGLALLWPAGDAGTLLLPTTRLPVRSKPYNLNLELARARIMLITKKREDWGLWDYSTAERISAEFDEVRRLFIEAVKAESEDSKRAAEMADECLSRGVLLSEEMTLFHANIFLSRRRKAGNFRTAMGCAVDLQCHAEGYRQRAAEAFDFISLPMTWKRIEPKEHEPSLSGVDAWSDWCVQRKMPIHAGPLISFEPRFFPEWLYIWEHDYETLREMMYEHVQRMVTRYAKRVRCWNVVSGIYAYNNFNLSFEQIMELTRMTCSLVKKISPQAAVLVDLVRPWGEYYARNQRTIPPMMYADMCVQSGVKFDAFGVQVLMGAAEDGLYVRDMMQISDMLDGFVSMGKPVHVTLCGVPSGSSPDAGDHWRGQAQSDQAGHWRRPWNCGTQADWLEMFYHLALSRPFVETVSWRDLADIEGHYLPHGGLCQGDASPKRAYERLQQVRSLLKRTTKAGATANMASAKPGDEKK